MSKATETVISYLEKEGYNFDHSRENSVITTGFMIDTWRVPCVINLDEENERIIVYSYAPFNIEADIRPSILALTSRANYGLLIGNFEFDLNDGELRYKTSIDVEGGELTERMFETLLSANLVTHENYMPAIRAVIDDGVPPADAIAAVEGPNSK